MMHTTEGDAVAEQMQQHSPFVVPERDRVDRGAGACGT